MQTVPVSGVELEENFDHSGGVHLHLASGNEVSEHIEIVLLRSPVSLLQITRSACRSNILRSGVSALSPRNNVVAVVLIGPWLLGRRSSTEVAIRVLLLICPVEAFRKGLSGGWSAGLTLIRSFPHAVP